MIKNLTDSEKAFIKANPNVFRILYCSQRREFPKVLKTSEFIINKGYAFIITHKLLRKFRNCHITVVIEEDIHGNYVDSFHNLAEAILWRKPKNKKKAEE